MDLAWQLKLRERPEGRRVVMRQRWEELLFLHWEVNPEVIQATLPAGLEVDTFEGKTYLGIVPFFMRNVRPAVLPAVSWLSNFMECNLRTYVIGPEGPGVWFYSLDCNQPLAVEVARSLFHLPYFHAEMSVEREDVGWIRYETSMSYKPSLGLKQRQSVFRYKGGNDFTEAAEESLDFFLLERYQLYASSFRKNRLYAGRVWHHPYKMSEVEVDQMDHQLIEVAGFNSPERDPEWIHYSPGVDVSIFGLKDCTPA